MNLSRNIGALSLTHSWRGKTASITYSECVCVCVCVYVYVYVCVCVGVGVWVGGCVCGGFLINIQHAPFQSNITCFRVKQLHLYYFWIVSLLHY